MNNKTSASKDFKSKLFTTVLVILMPYIGFFILLIKRPFSKKTNIYLSIYCVLMSVFLFTSIFSKNFNNTNQADEISNISQQQNIENKQIEVEPPEKTAEPFYRLTIEEEIKKLYSEGLDFSTMNYIQWDPMEIELYHCKNTFTGKMTKKEHSYLARVGYNKDTNSSTLYFLSIDGETKFWNEDGETKFIDSRE
jgi:hypothetical protein